MPILKSKKLKTEKLSYRPIANLCVYDKIIQELLKRQLSSYFEGNNLILKNHHGGRKGHSTVTARAVIDVECAKIVDQNKLGFVFSTDLSVAFDTVDVKILMKKMEYYGVEKSTLEILESFLSERQQYTELEHRQSDMIDSLACSVVQGSKLSTLLYTIYTNEVPVTYKLLGNEQWMVENLKKTKN